MDSIQTIPRYVWRNKPEPGYDWDSSRINAECWDRLTGKCLLRYDLGDPANWDSNYGGWSNSEWIESRKADPKERIEPQYDMLKAWPKIEGEE